MVDFANSDHSEYYPLYATEHEHCPYNCFFLNIVGNKLPHALCQDVSHLLSGSCQLFISSSSHCSVFALSDSSDSALQQKCEHSHDEFCDQCESLHFTLNNISTPVDGALFTAEEQKDEALFLLRLPSSHGSAIY